MFEDECLDLKDPFNKRHFVPLSDEEREELESEDYVHGSAYLAGEHPHLKRKVVGKMVGATGKWVRVKAWRPLMTKDTMADV